jgi:hypothetical protein
MSKKKRNKMRGVENEDSKKKNTNKRFCKIKLATPSYE